jgi:hypothetical protein
VKHIDACADQAFGIESWKNFLECGDIVHKELLRGVGDPKVAIDQDQCRLDLIDCALQSVDLIPLFLLFRDIRRELDHLVGLTSCEEVEMEPKPEAML